MNSEPDIPEEDLQWHCVRTLTKREFIASEILKKSEIEVLCPRIRYKKVTKRGTVWWREAMFPGYFFARFSVAHQGRLVTYSQGVSGLVKFNNQVPAIPESFIAELREHLAKNTSEDAETLTLAPELNAGDEVEVIHGPLAGQKGQVTKILIGVERVAILLEFLGAEQEVEIDLFSLLLKRPVPVG